MESSYSIGYYGKLPFYGDYLSLHADGPVVQALHQWFQEGIYRAKQYLPNWSEDIQVMPRYAFLFHLGDRSSRLLGTFGASQDAKERHFPFTVFTIIDETQNSIPLASLPLIFSQFLRSTHRFINQDWLKMDRQVFSDQFQTLSVAMESNSLPTQLAETTLSRFMEKIIYNSEEKLRVFLNVIQFCATCRRQGGGQINTGLRLPLSWDNQQWYFETSFWLSLVFSLLREVNVDPWIFWNCDMTRYQPYLFLFLSLPIAGHFVHLIKPDLESGLINHVEQIKGNEKLINNQTKILMQNLLSDPNIRVKDFLEQLTLVNNS